MKKNIIDDISICMMSNTNNEFDYSDFELRRMIDGILEIDKQGRDGRTLLIHAALYHRKLIAEFLLNKGANISVCDNKGITALHAAVISDDFEMVKLFLLKGASVNAKDFFGNIPLFYVKRNNIQLIELLMHNGANYNSKNYSGISAIDIFQSYPKILKLFK